MPPFSPTGGVDETEPTLIPDDAVQDCDGAEYRVGQNGLYVARGRDLYGTIAGVTGTALYEAGFDESAGFVLAQAGDALYSATIGSSLTFTQVDTFTSGSSAMVGTHYANRHYLATGNANRRIEGGASGVTSYPVGMSPSVLGITATVSNIIGGSESATVGLVYWVTEYDSARGIESITGSSCQTAPFTDKRFIQVVATGVTTNPTADTLRWYRSVDGGGFPDGGLLGETPIGTTFFNDGGPGLLADGRLDIMAPTSVLTVPLYGLVSLGGVDVERDTQPPALSTIFGPFNDSLLGVSPLEPRNLRFSAAGYPESWPETYGIPLDTHRRDEIVVGVMLPGRIGVFCIDSVHAVYRLPRDSDSIFAPGEMSKVIADTRGCASRRGATVFTPPGSDGLVAFVARDGIWLSDLSSSPVPVTDKVDWEGRISTLNLSSCRLVDDPRNRRLVFLYRRETDTTYSTGIWYLDYQEFAQRGIRVSFGDHGPLADAQTVATPDGKRTLVSIDSRAGNGQTYQESVQDVDDSHLLDSSGSVRFRMRTKEFMPAGPQEAADLGNVSWMHDAGPPRIEHWFYFDRRDDNPEFKLMERTEERNASDVILNRSVNGFSLEIQSVGTRSYGVHWIDVDTMGAESLGGREGV
jgi:hypothetical protein